MAIIRRKLPLPLWVRTRLPILRPNWLSIADYRPLVQFCNLHHYRKLDDLGRRLEIGK